MPDKMILPSEIPWGSIKGPDLEELLYWLFDSMGAKELEWRIGGKGGGGADQGRDLELAFFSPSPDGTLSKQRWWVEAKGRAKTVAQRDVQEAIINVAGKKHIEVLVIATNANFSNPTRDWVKDWQRDNPRPTIKLWERTELENLCSKNPLAVIRLHARAISPQGKVQITSSKFWDYATLSDEPTLKSIWDKRGSVEIDARALLALTSSEIANGDVCARPWPLLASTVTLISCLSNGLINCLYLAFRANEVGVRQEPLIRALSYLTAVTCEVAGRDKVAAILAGVWDTVENKKFPSKIREMILGPILDNLLTELKDVCTRDCSRISTELELLQERDTERYWDRLRLTPKEPQEDRGVLTIEKTTEACKVGFPVNENNGCPLCNLKGPEKRIADSLRVVETVIRFRKDEKEGA